MYTKRTKQEVLFLRRSLSNLKYDSSTTIRAHIDDFKELIEQLVVVGAPVPKDELVLQLLETFPSFDFGVIISILMNEKNNSFKDACEALEDHMRHIIASRCTKESAMVIDTRKRSKFFESPKQQKRF